MRKYLLTTFLFFMSSIAFADIYCPGSLACVNQNCMGSAQRNPIFTQMIKADPSQKIPNDTYHFSSAWAGDNATVSCSYRNKKGQTWFFLKASKTLYPDLIRSNNWVQNYCSPNLNKPYLTDPENCPFLDVK